MATFTRKNAWNQGGTFSNPDLLWYAKAVGEMQSRALNDETSWWFFAAIHGHRWIDIPSPPNVPNTPEPSPSQKKQYWDQCQHGTWFFLPWHRGYLFAIENVLREIIESMGGPTDWALPYWDYFGNGNQYQIPPAFNEEKLPDGSPNPLLTNARYGPNNNKIVFIAFSKYGITQDCQKNTIYEGDQPNYYGGGETGFEHSGYDSRGSIESNPHNPVHVSVGGQNPQTGRGGLMSNPNTAGLDPIFYLHHCNIDRMWATWNKDGNKNSDNQKWLDGPTSTGDRKFYMPKPDKTAWQFTPRMVTDISLLDYTYEDLSLGVPPLLASKNNLRLRTFGFQLNELKNNKNMKPNKIDSELVGASNNSVVLDASGLHTSVKLESKSWKKVTKSLNNLSKIDTEEVSAEDIPDEVYLQLEGVKGKEDSIVCTVSVNHQYVGHISLFGLHNASLKDDAHGGGGLTIKLDITKVVDHLHLNDLTDISALDVLIQPVNMVTEGNELTIDRISIYRKTQS